MDILVEVDIAATKEQVWNAITDIAGSADVISGIVTLEMLHEPNDGLIGLKWTETRKMFGKEASETMWITECKDQAYYCTRAENHGAVYISKISIRETGDTTRLSRSFSMSSESFITNLIGSVMGVVMKRSMKKLVLADMNDIKKFVELRSP